MADLRAQIAALRVGQENVGEIMKRMGRDTVIGAMDSLMTRSQAAFLKEVEAIPEGVYEFEDFLDDDGFVWVCPFPSVSKSR